MSLFGFSKKPANKVAAMLAKRMIFQAALVAALLMCAAGMVNAADEKAHGNECKSLPSFATLRSALDAATAAESSGLNNQMWATIVDRDGVVCAIAFSGINRSAQWRASRVISAQKANTASSLSLDSTSSSGGSGQPNGLSL